MFVLRNLQKRCIIVNRHFHAFKEVVNACQLLKKAALGLITISISHCTMTSVLKGQIVIYSVVGCPHCTKAKSTLQSNDLPYNDINLEIYPQCREYVKEKTGKTTVPQIFFNERHIGGNDDLQKLVADKDEFQKLIEYAKQNEAPPGAPIIPDPSTAKTSDKGEFVCEPDEYAMLVQELKKSGLIKDHRSGLSNHKNSFSGKEFVDWVVKKKGLERPRAIEMGQALIDQHFGHHVKHNNEEFKDDNTYYRLIEDDESTALNAGTTSTCAPMPVNDLGEDIRKLILKIYSVFLSEDGKKVNYEGIRGSSEFEKYKKLTQELIRVRISEASRDEKVAFFINVYNALVVHANIERGPPTNLWQRYKFFNTVRYIIGGHDYSLQDIENGVLRANRKGVGMFSRPFGKSDPRLAVALETPEPLVHFALVCGAKSCPPIKTYSAQDLNSQLKMAAEAFLEGDDGMQIMMEKKEVQLSMIFKWYREDFGENDQEVVKFLHSLMGEGQKKQQLEELIQGGKVKVTHMSYDWSLNS